MTIKVRAAVLSAWLRAAAIILCAVCCLGCSWLQDACTKALPSLTKAQGLGVEATTRIDQAEAYAAQLPVTADQHAEINQEIAKARDAVAAGQAVIDAAVDACSATDEASAFGELVRIWTELEPLLVAHLAGARYGQTPCPVTPPLVVLMARRRLVAP